MSRHFLWWLVLAGAAGCQHSVQIANVPSPPISSHVRCYRGVGFGLVDTLAAPDSRRTHQSAYLVLFPAAASPADVARALLLSAPDTMTPGLPMFWALHGDSVVVDAMTFPEARWHFSVTSEGLRGTLHGASDVVRSDSSGATIPNRDEQPAVAAAIACSEVPGAGRLTSAEADKAPLR